MSYKSVLLKVTPKWAHRLGRDVYFSLRLIPNALYDARRFILYSGVNRSRDHKTEHAARVTLFYHQVEKGLSLASPRPGFGMTVIPRLLSDTEMYVSRYGWEPPATTAICALQAYVKFNDRHGHDAQFVRRRLEEIASAHPGLEAALAGAGGGTRHVTKAEIYQARRQSFADFFKSRYSVRNFSQGIVPEDSIASAVALAQKTPSVCNRQTWRVHAFRDREQIQKLMDIQAGGRGFGANISNILVVTCDLGGFVEVAERYQAWIDGGMFAMSLCLALHDQGYGTCCLNWSKEAETDRRFRQAASIPAAEQIIMLVAVGLLPDQFDVAYSFRPPVNHCLVWH